MKKKQELNKLTSEITDRATNSLWLWHAMYEFYETDKLPEDFLIQLEQSKIDYLEEIAKEQKQARRDGDPDLAYDLSKDL